MDLGVFCAAISDRCFVTLASWGQLRLLPSRRGRHSMQFVACPLVISVCLLVVSTVLAQVPEGTIRGVVADMTGAVVTTASLRISQPGFGGGRAVPADAYGAYHITNL